MNHTKLTKFSFADAAFQVLKKAVTPMSPKAICEEIIARDLFETKSKRPEATLNVYLHRDARFRCVSRGLWLAKRG